MQMDAADAIGIACATAVTTIAEALFEMLGSPRMHMVAV
jgi:hypothetical protein